MSVPLWSIDHALNLSTLTGDGPLYFIEYCKAQRLRGGVDENDVQWERYRPSFDSFERADNEAMWLSVDDSQYIYRVVEE